MLEEAGRELAAALAKLRCLPDSLFDGGIDPLVVIRWKDIYERLEAGIDASHHAGNTLEGLLMKGA